jgi:HD-GYP domain-containing protein (c-di-GMP phosphodiesterase class II)
MRFSEAIAMGIHNLDEHWNGGGNPVGLEGKAIPIYSRIALLAQIVDVFHIANGEDAALAEVRHRSGTWFDPELVRAFEQVALSGEFWAMLKSERLQEAVFALEPAQHILTVDEDYLDDITAAFAQVIDAKSPFTSGHSERVTLYTDMIAEDLGIAVQRRRWLKRAALLHDIGKLGVSNTVLDKAGELDANERAAMQRHAAYTQDILEKVALFEDLAPIAGAHHERLDGKGYPHGLKGDEIAFETRIITAADIFDALSADRPYKAAMPFQKALSIMAEMVGTAVDSRCLEALRRAVAQLEDPMGGVTVAATRADGADPVPFKR